jgi:glycosyltransferase involved in cell wall biosynthesis
MRIAFLDSWLQQAAEGSGTAVAIGGLAEALTARGHRVERVLPPPAGGLTLLGRRLAYNLRLPRRLGSTAYDLIVGFDIDGFRIAGACPVPYVCSIKGVLAEEARCERGWPRRMLALLALLERRNARRADLVLSTSRYCCERIHAHYGVSPERLRQVPEGIDLSLWQPREATADAQVREPYRVLCVARQYPRKRIADLITAFATVVRRLPQARLTVIGDGPEHGDLVALAERLGLEEQVELLGALASDAEVRAWYGRASVFCLPSEQEGFGIVFLEAMAAGLPVVSTTAAAIPEVVPHGQAGLLVPPRDPQALAGALLQLLGDHGLQEHCRSFGRLHVQDFSWDRVAERFLAAVAPLMPPEPPWPGPPTER